MNRGILIKGESMKSMVGHWATRQGYYEKQEGNAIGKGKISEFNSVRKGVVVVECDKATSRTSSVVKDKLESIITGPIDPNMNYKGWWGQG